MRFGKAANVLAVRVDHSRIADSRWYTGSGIYRHVRLRLTDALHSRRAGIFITTPKVENDSAVIHVETEIQNNSTSAASVSLVSEILSPDGSVVATKKTSVSQELGRRNQIAVQEITVEKPELGHWDAALRITAQPGQH